MIVSIVQADPLLLHV